MNSYTNSQLIETIEAQNTTIKKLREENLKTINEAREIIGRYQKGIDLSAKCVALLEARINKLECDSISRSWDAQDGTNGTHKKGETNKNGEGQNENRD